MAFDGITIANLTRDFSDMVTGGRIYKIAQTESDELFITVKLSYEAIEKYNIKQTRLVLSADASLPLVYMTDESKASPMTAPNFCMLLRKHIQNGRIISVTQPGGLERIIRFEIEHLDEMGDLCHKILLIEIMGKYSNIIFTDENDVIIDSIKHIPASVSSVREVLPGRTYFVPGQDKANPIATILSAAMMLRYAFGLSAEAQCIEDAVDAVLAAGFRTADIIGDSEASACSCTEMTAEILKAIG